MGLRKYDKDWLQELCASSFSYAEVLQKAGRKPGGGNQAILKSKVKEFDIDVSHFTGQRWNKGKTAATDDRIASQARNAEKYQLEEVFRKDSKITQKGLRGYIERYQIILYKCNICGCNGNWQNGKIALEIHHKDGIKSNNEISNLVYLCPNCHALTENYRGKNVSKKETLREEISEEVFCEALKSTPNIRQALIKLDLAPKGANYTRAKNLLEKYSITQK